MQDLNGSFSFNLDDLGQATTDSRSQDMTLGEKMSDLLSGIDQIEIKNKKVEKKSVRLARSKQARNPVGDSMDDYYKSEDQQDDSDTLAGSFELDLTAGEKKSRKKFYSVSVDDDDTVYHPMKDEVEPETKINSITSNGGFFSIFDQSQQEDEEEADNSLSDSSDILDLTDIDNHSIGLSSKSSKPSQYQDDAEMLISSLNSDQESESDSYDRATDLSTENSSINLTKSKAGKKKPQGGIIEPKRNDRSFKSFISKIDDEPKPIQQPKSTKDLTLKQTESSDEDEEEAFKDSRFIPRNNKSVNDFNNVLNSMKENNQASESNISEIILKTKRVMTNLEEIESGVSDAKTVVSRDIIAGNIIADLEKTIKETGRHFMEVNQSEFTTDVQDILKSERNLSFEFNGNLNTYIVHYNYIPQEFKEIRTRYLTTYTKKLKDVLIRVARLKQERMQSPIVLDISDNSVLAMTEPELHSIKRTLDKGYTYEIKDTKIYIWGVKKS